MQLFLIFSGPPIVGISLNQQVWLEFSQLKYRVYIGKHSTCQSVGFSIFALITELQEVK